jgi:hypothetical protein
MADFDVGASIGTIVGKAQSLGSNAAASFGQLGSASSLGMQLSSALNNLANPANLISRIRSVNLPPGGDIIGKLTGASAMFGGSDANSDWRVRLTVPGGTIFDSSSVFAPLKAAGGLVFPYTPTINIGSSAKYSPVDPIHNNYPFHAYQNSAPDQIQIVAPMHVEDAVQAQYWIAAMHFLRSVTKMFSGESSPAGNPPPILSLNGYGEYVFKNVPVVVTNFNVSLDAGSDYISTISSAGAGGNALGQLGNIVSQIPGAQSLGAAIGAGSSLLNSALSSSGGATGGSHVPTKSSFTVTLQSAYSRESVRTFSLQKFVNGDYMTSSGAGYI